MALVAWEIDPTSEDAANVSVVLTSGTPTSGLRLLSQDVSPPSVSGQFTGSVDTEGDFLVDTKRENRIIELGLDAVNTSAALLETSLSQLHQKLDKLRREGGTLKFSTPSGDSVVYDVLYAESSLDLGLIYAFRNRSQVTLRFTCKPHGRGAAVTLADHTEATLPVLIFTETTITGDAPALGRLVIDDDQGVSQYTAIWGVQSRYYDSASSAALFFQAEGLTLQGAGAATSTAAAGYSGTGSVLANALATTYQSMLSSQATGGGAHWSHVGEFRIYARVFVPTANTGDVSVQGRWAVGDGRVWTSNPDVTISSDIKGVWRLVDLGPVNIPKAVAGTQRWELRLLAKSTVAGDDVQVDFLMLLPTTEGSGVVSAVPAAIDYSAFQARDEFTQSAGALAGKTPNTGGNWAGTGDADDFATNGTGRAQRTAVSDTAGGINNARLETMATPSSLAGLAVFDTMASPAPAVADALFQGSLVRYVDASNYLAVYAVPVAPSVSAGAQVYVQMVERIAGTNTVIATSGLVPCDYTNVGYTLGTIVGVDGAYIITVQQGNGGVVTVLQGQSPNLVAGGTLASGKVGILDYYTDSTALTRYHDNFVAYAASNDAAVFASQSLEIRNDRVIREDSGGTLWQPVSSYEGDYHLVPPAGREARTVRYILKLSRGPLETGIDGGIDDLSGRLTFTPRYLVVPE